MKQGLLGDCWFLCACAALSRNCRLLYQVDPRAVGGEDVILTCTACSGPPTSPQDGPSQPLASLPGVPGLPSRPAMLAGRRVPGRLHVPDMAVWAMGRGDCG